MSNCYLIDTNIILRYLLKDIPHQYEQAEQVLQKAKERKLQLILAEIVIFEVLFALQKVYHFDKNTIITTLQTLLATEYLQVASRDVFLSALTLYKTTTVSFVDCFLLSKAKGEGAEVFTFDQKLQKLQG